MTRGVSEVKVAVLMSGGVDSTIAALLLREAGHQVLGLTMVNWDEEAARKARAAAGILDIRHHVVDLREVFQDRVVDYFCQSYARGETPNPCVECNKWIKFGPLLDKALELGCSRIATGHYAQVETGQQGRYLLKRGVDAAKDQSYFLHGLTQEQLSCTLFPLGSLLKEQVRCMGGNHGLPAAREKESQEICFIPGDYRDFLKERINYQPGPIMDLQGRVLGVHQGLPFYTIGQRKGLGISGGRPIYVVSLDREKNQVYMGDEESLLSHTLWAADCNFIAIPSLTKPLTVNARIRYRAPLAEARITPEGNLVRVDFSTPQRAIASGQSVVFYQGDYVVGGGRIVSHHPARHGGNGETDTGSLV
ncbi:MAG TPA: tRNA 2-thiouridine(34) synthase MnmA [Syntrophomonadaceae bacterium]|nr:tRNA 2-thiouridine(34) synthase MnmA [Syntrophomonadaceae bacterium]